MTYYVYPEPDVPYTGASETDKIQWLSRKIEAAMGWPSNYTQRINRYWRDGTTAKYYPMPDAWYTQLVSAGALSAWEQAHAVTTLPTGALFDTNSIAPAVKGWLPEVVILVGDSITITSSFANADKLHALLLSQTGAYNSTAESYNATRQIINLGLATSGYSPNNAVSNDYRWNITYPWRLGNLRFAPGQKVIIQVMLATNDSSQSDGATIWGRAQTFFGMLRTTWPFNNGQVKLIFSTCVARSQAIADYNQSVRTNWATYADALADPGNLTEFKDTNYATVITNTTYYAGDGVHPTAVGTAIFGPHQKSVIDSVFSSW